MRKSIEFAPDFLSNMCYSWLPIDPLRFCLSHTGCKLVLVDAERATVLEPLASGSAQIEGIIGFLVLDSHEGKGTWKGMECFNRAIESYRDKADTILENDPNMVPEDNASIMFTSGEIDARCK